MSLHLILGPMFSGKSTRLIEHIRAFRTLDYNILVIKPDIDCRYTQNEICTHNQEKESCMVLPIDSIHKLLETDEFKKAKIIIIEEGQFFTNLYETVQEMLDVYQKQIYIAALNGDSKRQLFGDIYKLLPLCYEVEWMKALCIRCKDGTPGIYSKRISHAEEQILVASNDKYEAVCLSHYLK